MSVDIQFEGQHHGVLVQCQGRLSARDLSQASDQVFKQVDGTAIEYEIWDFSAATGLDLSIQEIREMVQFDMQAIESGEKHPHKIAVVGNRKLVGALAMLYTHMSKVWSGNESEYFSSIHDARDWLNHH